MKTSFQNSPSESIIFYKGKYGEIWEEGKWKLKREGGRELQQGDLVTIRLYLADMYSQRKYIEWVINGQKYFRYTLL